MKVLKRKTPKSVTFATVCTLLYKYVSLSYSQTFVHRRFLLHDSISLPPYSTEREIDWKTVELKKLKVRELRKILNQWGEDCLGCAEKTDFIDKIERVKHSHVEL